MPNNSKIKYYFISIFFLTIILLDFFGYVDSVRLVTLGVSSRIASPASAIANSVTGFFHAAFSIPKLLSEAGKNDIAIRELAEARADIEVLNRENDKLREVLKFNEDTGVGVISCPMIGRDLVGVGDAYVIGCGSDQGVSENMIVLGGRSVFGVVILSQKNTSTIRPIDSSSFSIDGVLASSLEPVVVKGSVGREVYAEIVDSKVVVKRGDVVTTSSLSGRYPGGVLIGIVGEEISSGDLTRKFSLEVFSGLEMTRSLYVIKR